MKILVVDDDRTLADILAFTFKREGYEVILAEDGEEALQSWRVEKPDLVILDVNIPKLDGFAVCRSIREKAVTPIIFLSVRSNEDDIVNGLNLGADDYMTKPFSPGQLVARVRVVLRRAGQIPPASYRKAGKIRLDLKRHELMIEGVEPIKLTRLEYRLIECLMINAGQVVNAGIIMDYVWGPVGGSKDRTRHLVHRLRNKIERDKAKSPFIESIPGMGYSLPASLVNC